MTRNGRKKRIALELKSSSAESYNRLFASLFYSAIQIIDERTGEPVARTKKIIEYIYKNGCVAYDKRFDVWLPFTVAGVPDLYGEYQNFILRGENGKSIKTTTADGYAFTMTQGATLSNYIAQRCALIANFDLAIMQNLNAVKQMTLLVANDKLLCDELREAIDDLQNGESVGIIQKDAKTLGGEITTLKTDATYYVTNLIEDRAKIYKECLHLVGVYTPLEKGERVIESEIATTNAEADSNIGAIIDEFNEQARAQSAPYKAIFSPIRQNAGADVGTVDEQDEDEEDEVNQNE